MWQQQKAHPQLSLVLAEGGQWPILNGHEASAASLRHPDVGGV